MAIASKATQDFVPIQEIRDSVVVLKDGSMRAIMLVTSINFDLKSEDEQRSIIMQFQNFLNSLDFSVQIFLQSRRYDIRPYLTILEGRKKEQANDLMRVQVEEYIEFIKQFAETRNVMSKTFFIVVSYAPPIIKNSSSFFSKILPGQKNTTIDSTQFEESRSQLEERVSVVEQGLARTGVRVARLGTEEVVELFYRLFNPGETDKPMIPTQ